VLVRALQQDDNKDDHDDDKKKQLESVHHLAEALEVYPLDEYNLKLLDNVHPSNDILMI